MSSFSAETPSTEIHEMLAKVTERVAKRSVFASIDVHNNTGKNPYYGCVCSTEPQHLYLASLFSRTVVYFTRPCGVQTRAFMKYCPSVTCECGKIGDHEGASRAADLIEACLRMDEFSHRHLGHDDVEVFHTVARIKVQEECSFGFTPDHDIVLRDDLEALNFIELARGEALGTLRRGLEECFTVNDESGKDVTDEFLTTTKENVCFGRAAMPSMFTCNLDVIRQDCLGYLMERYPIEV